MFGFAIADWLDILKCCFNFFLFMMAFGTIMSIGIVLGEIQEERWMEEYEKQLHGQEKK